MLSGVSNGQKMEWSISVPIFRNAVIVKQLGLAIGIPFGLLTIVIIILSGKSVYTLYGLGLIIKTKHLTESKHKIIPRILISLLGITLILLGIGYIALGAVGELDIAVITNIRREGGELTDGKPGRYIYNISYTFTLPHGEEVNGFTKKIGDSIYVKADGKSTVRVRYLSRYPNFNALERDTGFGAKQLLFIIAGSFLIYVINSKG